MNNILLLLNGKGKWPGYFITASASQFININAFINIYIFK